VCVCVCFIATFISYCVLIHLNKRTHHMLRFTAYRKFKISLLPWEKTSRKSNSKRVPSILRNPFYSRVVYSIKTSLRFGLPILNYLWSSFLSQTNERTFSRSSCSAHCLSSSRRNNMRHCTLIFRYTFYHGIKFMKIFSFWITFEKSLIMTETVRKQTAKWNHFKFLLKGQKNIQSVNRWATIYVIKQEVKNNFY